MKLQKLFEETPDVSAMRQAGVYCSPEEFQENYDLIIDLQRRMNAMYDDLEDKLHAVRVEDDEDFDVPQILSSIELEPDIPGSQRRRTAWFFFDRAHEDYELIRKTARAYIDRAFKRFLPELEATFEEFHESNVHHSTAYYTLNWGKKMPEGVEDIYFNAPDTEDGNYSNKRRKALKWW